MGTTTTPKEFTAKARTAILERAGGRCEGCGAPGPLNIHHRLYKSRGGRGDIANGLALCGLGNASGCHQRAHTGEGAELGWAVPSWGRYEWWPTRRWDTGWVLLFNEPDSRGRWFDTITDATATLLMRGEAS